MLLMFLLKYVVFCVYRYRQFRGLNIPRELLKKKTFQQVSFADTDRQQLSDTQDHENNLYIYDGNISCKTGSKHREKPLQRISHELCRRRCIKTDRSFASLSKKEIDLLLGPCNAFPLAFAGAKLPYLQDGATTTTFVSGERFNSVNKTKTLASRTYHKYMLSDDKLDSVYDIHMSSNFVEDLSLPNVDEKVMKLVSSFDGNRCITDAPMERCAQSTIELVGDDLANTYYPNRSEMLESVDYDLNASHDDVQPLYLHTSTLDRINSEEKELALPDDRSTSNYDSDNEKIIEIIESEENKFPFIDNEKMSPNANDGASRSIVKKTTSNLEKNFDSLTELLTAENGKRVMDPVFTKSTEIIFPIISTETVFRENDIFMMTNNTIMSDAGEILPVEGEDKKLDIIKRNVIGSQPMEVCLPSLFNMNRIMARNKVTVMCYDDDKTTKSYLDKLPSYVNLTPNFADLTLYPSLVERKCYNKAGQCNPLPLSISLCDTSDTLLPLTVSNSIQSDIEETTIPSMKGIANPLCTIEKQCLRNITEDIHSNDGIRKSNSFAHGSDECDSLEESTRDTSGGDFLANKKRHVTASEIPSDYNCDTAFEVSVKSDRSAFHLNTECPAKEISTIDDGSTISTIPKIVPAFSGDKDELCEPNTKSAIFHSTEIKAFIGTDEKRLV